MDEKQAETMLREVKETREGVHKIETSLAVLTESMKNQWQVIEGQATGLSRVDGEMKDGYRRLEKELETAIVKVCEEGVRERARIEKDIAEKREESAKDRKRIEDTLTVALAKESKSREDQFKSMADNLWKIPTVIMGVSTIFLGFIYFLVNAFFKGGK